MHNKGEKDMIKKVIFTGYNDKKEKVEKEVIGEVIKESEKQIVIKDNTGTSYSINLSKIIKIDEVDLIETENTVLNLDGYSQFLKLCNEIVSGSNDVLKGFLRIGRSFKIIEEKKLYLLDGYNDFYEFCENKFKYKETSVKNMIAVYKKYKSEYTKDEGYFVEVDNKYKDYSYTALVELLPVSEKEIEKKFKPDMSVKEIRQVKSMNQLTDELKNVIQNYNHVVKILTAEVENFNKEYKKKIIKINIDKNNSLSLENYYQRVEFTYSWRKYYVVSMIGEWLIIDYQKKEFNDDLELIENFNERFLKYIKKDLKDKENEKKEKIEKKKETKVYTTFFTYSLEYKGLKYLWSIYSYFMNFVLKNLEFDYCNVAVKYYEENKEYDFSLFFNEESIGVLRINVDSQYIYLDIKDCENEDLKKKYHYERETLYEIIYNLGDKLRKYLIK